MNSTSSGGVETDETASVEVVLIELPALPQPRTDVVRDVAGYSAEMSVEREVAAHEVEAVSAAALSLMPIVRIDGEHEVRGLVSLDDATLWVYVHSIGPGEYGQDRQDEARSLLEHLWRLVHEASADR